MSFTRRNVAIRSGTQRAPTQQNDPNSQQKTTPVRPPAAERLPGTRPSPVDGRPTTSTGCLSLDGLLAGHAGLPLGHSLLIGENGTTDYASTLLRYFAAEGVVQGHKVHVVGFAESWGRALPSAIGAAHAGEKSERGTSANSDRMKIAWRYERLGEFGAGNAQGNTEEHSSDVFCHAFDLTKRMTFDSPDRINFIPVDMKEPNPFSSIQQALAKAIKADTSNSLHRIIIPSLLSPFIYPSSACKPSVLLPFLHSLRALLRTYPTRLVLMLSLPLTLHPRSTGLTRWMELLSDGVLELVPFPHRYDQGDGAGGSAGSSSLSASGAATALEEKPQGMLRVHRLPVFHERGGGGIGSAGVEDDLAFTVSRKRFVVKPFSLPPLEGDQEAQGAGGQGAAVQQPGTAKAKGLPRKEDLEF